MDTNGQQKTDISDIPKKIFTQFIEDLKKTAISTIALEQLEKTIVNEGNFTELALREALSKNPDL